MATQEFLLSALGSVVAIVAVISFASPHLFGLIFTDAIPGFVAPEDGPTVRAWGRWHGLVSLEVFHHLDWTGIELDRLFDAEVDAIVVELSRQLGIEANPTEG